MKITYELELQSVKISGMAAGTNPADAVTKSQLDAAIEGLKHKNPVKAASTANLTLSGAQTIDGISIVAGDRILVKDQTTGSQNGIYVAASGSWTRATDMDSSDEVEGSAVFISQGTTHGNQRWQMITDGPITLGTTSLTWAQIGGGTSYSEGTGIDISGGIISIDAAVVARKVVAIIGNGSNTSFTINHGLNNSSPVVQVWETGGDKEEVITDKAVVDANNVSVSFAAAPAASAYEVRIIG